MRFKICLNENLDGLLASMNFDAHRRIPKSTSYRRPFFPRIIACVISALLLFADLSDARRQSSGDRKAAEADKRKSPGPDPGLSGATLRAPWAWLFFGGGCCAPTTGNKV